MTFLNTKYKRKSAVITTIVMLLLILLLFGFGLDYKDPPDEYGVEINFGYTDKGSGDNTTSTEEVKTSPNQQQTPAETTPIEETPTEPVKPTEPVVEEEVMTQDTEDAPTVNNQPQTEPVTENNETAEEPVKDPVEEPTPPKPDQSTLDMLNSANNGPTNDGTSNNGDGDSTTPGNQGAVNGNPYANAYYGDGTGTSGYGKLNGRSKESVKKFEQPENQEGKVVVKIWVSRSGNVTKAQIQNSNNPTLNAAALKTAKSYKFSAAPNAPATQQGFVIINFTLGQ